MSLRNKKSTDNYNGNDLAASSAWKHTFGCDAPARIGSALRSALLTQGVQERALGKSFRALDRRIASAALATSKTSANHSVKKIGTRLVRGWGGVNHEVSILPKGFGYRGVVYRSLSEIARLITGARWSGPRFFSLKNEKAL